jgi:hypothetical protein
MKVDLTITRKHIKNGVMTDPNGCPIASSIKDKIKNLKRVSVFVDYATIIVSRNNRNQYLRASLNDMASSFVRQFDGGMTVEPFKVTLNFTKKAANAFMVKTKE